MCLSSVRSMNSCYIESMNLSENFYHQRKLETLVENQTSYELNNVAMHVFETHERAENILLRFDQPVLASMISGKKIMHLRDTDAFGFHPGESLIMPAKEVMCIDFPEARTSDPTRCLAMAIDEQRILQIIQMMNERMPRADRVEWSHLNDNFHFTNDQGIYQIIQRLLFLFTENHPSKEFFVDNMLVELIVRILQTNQRKIHVGAGKDQVNNNRISAVVNYILMNLDKPLTIEELGAVAHMSTSNLHRVFKSEMGMSPVSFVNIERIRKAMDLLRDPGVSIKEVYIQCGFQNRSYFNRLFRKVSSLSPNEYQVRMGHSSKLG